jgi:hypothetical protein
VATVPLGFGVRRTLREVRARPDWQPPEAIELVTALSRALRQAPDADGGNRTLHHRWVRIFEEMFDAVGKDLTPRTGFDAVSVGAGRRNPFALPLLLHLAGARRVWVVEPELAHGALDPSVTWGLQEIALRALAGDLRSRHFVRPPSALDSFADLRGLFFGDPAAALCADAVRVVRDYVEDSAIPSGTIHLVTSRSVLEHVTATEACFDALGAMMAPGGLMYHAIDLSAHDDGDPFAFYYEEDEREPARRTDGLNGLRLGDYLAAFAARGFESRVVDRTLLGDYDLTRRPLRARFRRYGEEDLRCRRAVIVSRKKTGDRV